MLHATVVRSQDGTYVVGVGRFDGELFDQRTLGTASYADRADLAAALRCALLKHQVAVARQRERN
jgi:hypothetical protein